MTEPLRMINTATGAFAVAGPVSLGTPSAPMGVTTGAGPATQFIAPANLYADLSTATAATINQLRQAFQIQKIYERDARGGTRYTETHPSSLRCHVP